MKKIKGLIFTLIIFLTSINVVSAACTSEESNRLNSLAVNVKANYEQKKDILDKNLYSPPDGLSDEEIENYETTYIYFTINIMNLTEDLYVKVYNDLTKKTETYYYENSKNGTISFDWKEVRAIVNYTITVYSSDKTDCKDTKLYTLYLTTPRYNEYSNYDMCEGIEEYYLCHDFLTVDDVEFDKFVSLVNEYKDKKATDDDNDTNIENSDFLNFIKEHKVAIIVTVVTLVAAGGLITVIIIRKQRRVI